jgi:hypothetical protein
MQKAISISLLPFMLLQAAGYLIVFGLQRHEIRKEIKQQIKAGVPEEELVLLKIPKAFEAKPNPLFQRIHAHEFRYNGGMYDIVRQEAHEDTTWYYCLSDEKETQLFANLEELVKSDMNQNSQRRERNEKLQRLLDSLFCSDDNGVAWVYSAEAVELTHDSFSLKTWNCQPLTPPPKAQVFN